MRLTNQISHPNYTIKCNPNWSHIH